MERSLLFLCGCSLSGLLSAQITAVEWSAPVPTGTVAQGATRPRITMNGDGDPVVLWGRMGSMPANFVAVGDGVGFSTAQQVTDMSTPPAVANWMGADITSLGNEIWMCHKVIPEHLMPMYARRSLDGGYTWGDTIRILNDAFTRLPSIAIGTAGEPVVQYMQFDDGFTNARQVTTRMSGGVFLPSVPASAPFAPGDVCDCCPGQVVAAGNVVVPLYRNAGSNIRVIYGAVSTDGGTSYPTGGPVDVSNWNVAACPATGPDGYIAGDSVRYVWMTAALNGTKVRMSSAALSGLALGAWVLPHPGLPTSAVQNFPRIAGSGDTLGVVWEQNIGGDFNILFSWSTTGIHGLSAPDTVNTSLAGQQRTPDIAYADGAFHIVWSDEATDVVHYRIASLISATGIAGPVAPARFSAWPVPATTTLHVELADGANATLRLFDAAGHCLLTAFGGSQQLDLGGVAPGTYVLQASDAHGRAIGQVLVQVVR